MKRTLCEIPILYMDGIRDDTEALQAIFDGELARTLDGDLIAPEYDAELNIWVVRLPATGL